MLRPVSIDNFSKEICGGPHVTHTGVLEGFKITKEQSSSAGVRRIKAKIGREFKKKDKKVNTEEQQVPKKEDIGMEI